MYSPGNSPAANANASHILKEADSLILAESPGEALKLLTAFLHEKDNLGAWMKLARIYLLLGNEVVARSIYRNVLLKTHDPHIMDIIAARIPYCKVLVLDKLRGIYFNIPKCGSSSIKDAILVAHGMERRRETAHFHVKEFEKTLPLQSLRARYEGYTTFAVIRHPRARLRSYYTKNITEAKSLLQEAKSKSQYYGLSTLPGYGEIILNFRKYRCVFNDFRHHTDSIIHYVGPNEKNLDRVFDVSETDKAIEMLGRLGNVALPQIRNMESAATEVKLERDMEEREQELISSYYAQELKTYSRNFQLQS